MKFLFIEDKYAEGIYKDIGEQLKEYAPKLLTFECFNSSCEYRKIEKFMPDLTLYFYSLRNEIHRQQTSKQRKYRTASWLLEDKYDETLDIGHFYDYIFTIDKENLERRRKLGYTNIFYLSIEDIFKSIQRILYIYNTSNKDRRFKKEFYGEDICFDT